MGTLLRSRRLVGGRSCSMKDLQADITILAQSSSVWKVLTDVERFPDWNPFVREVRGTISPGSKLTIHVQPPNTRMMTFQATVLKIEPNRELVWLGRFWGIRGLLEGEQHFEIEHLSIEVVRLRQRAFFSGVLAALPPLSSILARRFQRGMESMNQAAKDRVEQTG